MNKTILFLSPFDFVEKGIQVIKMTPEHYAKNGWDVTFVITRDNSKFGSYYYEKELNPENLNVIRIQMLSLDWLLSFSSNKVFRTVITKFRQYFSIIQLLLFGFLELLKNRNITTIYGYGPIGTISAFILSKVFLFRSLKTISRFFGITDTDKLIASARKRWLNWEVLLALSLPVNACIITNDGTEGDKLLKHFYPKRLPKLHFWVNGVERIENISDLQIQDLKTKLSVKNEFIIISISRLVSWKRVDRSVDVMFNLHTQYPELNFKYFIIGGGPEEQNLKNKITNLNLDSVVKVLGPVNNKELPAYYSLADLFISTYDLSNVGNPLLEAIRYNKTIITLNNGDTKTWIQHNKNGFIFDINEHLIENISNCILNLYKNRDLKIPILKEIKKTESTKLRTWEERLNEELELVNQL